MNHHDHISFCLFFILFISSFFEVETFTPLGRWTHSSVLVGNKLYFFGGASEKSCSNEVFYLDVSQQFSIEFPPFIDITANEGIPFKSCRGTTLLRELNNEQTIFLCGGSIYDNVTNEDSFVHTLDLKSGRWNAPTITGKEPEKRTDIRGVIDDLGIIYIFGGKFDEMLNDMIILNTNDLTWSYGPIDNGPLRRSLYTATLLSNGMIVYIGGLEQITNNNSPVDINQINIYNTKLNTWSVMVRICNDYYEIY